MGRYDLLKGKPSEKQKQEQPQPQVPAGKNPYAVKVKAKKVKKLEPVWEIGDSKNTVFLEISNRDARCQKCQKKIPKGTPRYRWVRIGMGWYHNGDEVTRYHRKCCPSKLRKFIREYNSRDIDREEIEKHYEHTVWILSRVDENEYYQEYLERLARHISKVQVGEDVLEAEDLLEQWAERISDLKPKKR